MVPVGEGSVELVGHPNQSAATGGQKGLEDFSQARSGAESGKEQKRPSGYDPDPDATRAVTPPAQDHGRHSRDHNAQSHDPVRSLAGQWRSNREQPEGLEAMEAAPNGQASAEPVEDIRIVGAGDHALGPIGVGLRWSCGHCAGAGRRGAVFLTPTLNPGECKSFAMTG